MTVVERENRLQTRQFVQKKLVARQLAESLALYDESTNTAHCLEGFAADVWIACQTEISPAQLVSCLRPNWPEVSERDILSALDEMFHAGLLQESPRAEYISTERRKLIRKIGFAAAAAIPILVTSVLVPPAVSAASCARLGESCASIPCCRGLGLGCVGGTCVVI